MKTTFTKSIVTLMFTLVCMLAANACGNNEKTVETPQTEEVAPVEMQELNITEQDSLEVEDMPVEGGEETQNEGENNSETEQN